MAERGPYIDPSYWEPLDDREPSCLTCGDRGWVTNGGSLCDGSIEQLPCPDCQEGASS